MATHIIEPRELRNLASVPQCIDNQFIPANVYRKIAGNQGLREILETLLAGGTSAQVKQYLQQQKLEYLRSLIFSRQVIVNRAAFWNTPLLIQSALGPDRQGLVTLLAQEDIVPFLFQEEAFDDAPNFHVLPKGRDAARTLANDSSLSSLSCVRLGGPDNDANKRQAGAIASEFRGSLSSPLRRDDKEERLKDLARILLSANSGRRRLSKTHIEQLASRLQELASMTNNENPNRDAIYNAFITIGDDPSIGLFRDDAFTFELKQWIDVLYNSMLARFIGVLTFVPDGSPTPLDLGVEWALTSREHARPLATPAGGVLGEIVKCAQSRATWKAWDAVQKQADLSIPSPHQLSHTDVVDIRAWSEWETMMSHLANHLDRPLDAQNIALFQDAYKEFQKRLSVWWLNRNKSARKKWASGAATVYRVGSWMLGLLQVGTDYFPILPPPDSHLPPNFFSGAPIKLAVETVLYVFQRGQVDWKRTQVVRELTVTQEVSHSEITKAWEEIRRLYPDLPSELPGGNQAHIPATEEQYG